jgi:hypothetical protein
MRITTMLIAAGLAMPAGAQEPATCPKHAAPARSAHAPYAGLETRDIKALSEEQVRGYLEGHGAGLALAAELNHYPGPRHVLDLAAELALTSEQAAGVRTSFERMDAEARRLGEELVAAEARLDRLFASGAADALRLRTGTDEAGRLLSELRRVHLQAHVETRALLTADQVARYDALRGYAAGPSTGSGTP